VRSCVHAAKVMPLCCRFAHMVLFWHRL
jgi:hypothetical protein